MINLEWQIFPVKPRVIRLWPETIMFLFILRILDFFTTVVYYAGIELLKLIV